MENISFILDIEVIGGVSMNLGGQLFYLLIMVVGKLKWVLLRLKISHHLVILFVVSKIKVRHEREAARGAHLFQNAECVTVAMMIEM